MRSAVKEKLCDLPSVEPGIPGSLAVTGKDEIPTAQSNTEEAKRS